MGPENLGVVWGENIWRITGYPIRNFVVNFKFFLIEFEFIFHKSILMKFQSPNASPNGVSPLQTIPQSHPKSFSTPKIFIGAAPCEDQ